MIKSCIKNFFIFLFFVSQLFLFYLPTQNFTQEIKLNAESIVFDKNNNIVVAEQNVRLQYKDIVLETEKLFYDTQKNIVYISTDVLIS